MRLILLVGILLLYEKVISTCIQSYHSCGENGLLKCIPYEWMCDHNRDCLDGSDEFNCEKVTCLLDEYRCMNSDRCIKNSQKCDGYKDCEDNSDEKNCKLKECNKITEYDCHNDIKTECINLEHVCNRKSNCSNLENLKENCTFDKCKQSGSKSSCSHQCINKYSTFQCTCPFGMKLGDDNLNCKTIDVCLETPEICDQVCTSTGNGYSCSCYEGYTKIDNDCVLNDSKVAAYLLYLTYNGINAISLSKNMSSNRKLITMSDKLINFNIKINGKDMEIYSSHVDQEKVLSLNILNDWTTAIKGGNVEEVSKTSFKNFTWPTSFYSLAVDSSRNLVFWTDTKFSMISVFNSSSLEKIDLNITGCYFPISLVIDPISTKIFWIDLGAGTIVPRIMMANMDGTDVKELIKTGLHKPISLVLDVEMQMLYWSDLFPGSIKYLDLKTIGNDKAKIKTLFETYDFLPVSLALYKDRIYWSDLHQNRIYSVDKINGSGIKTVMEQVGSNVIRIISAHDELEILRKANDQSSYSCTGLHNKCIHSCLPTSSKEHAFCFESPREIKKLSSSSLWFIIIPIALILFAIIAMVKFRQFKLKNQRNFTDNTKTVLVYDHVKFWDDGREETINDTEVINVSDEMPILQTV